MKKLLALLLSVVLLCSFAGCGKEAALPVSDIESGAPEGGAATTTAVLAVTKADGTVETATDGSIVTTVVHALPTRMQTVTDAKGQAVTKADGTAVTEAITPPVVAVGTDPGGKMTTSAIPSRRVTTTTTHTSVNVGSDTTSGGKSDGSTVSQKPSTTTTTKKVTTTTTKKPTTTTKKPTTTTTTKAPTVSSKDPWKYPYDIAEITRQCREIIEKADTRFVWDDSLTVDNSGWNNPTNTGYYTDHPNSSLTLKEEMKNDFLPYEIEEHQTLGYWQYQIYFEPDPENKGDYYIYWLYL